MIDTPYATSEFEETSEFGEIQEESVTPSHVEDSTISIIPEYCMNNADGMQDDIAKEKLAAIPILEMILWSLIPEYGGYAPADLSPLLLEAQEELQTQSWKAKGPHLKNCPTEIAQPGQKQVRLDIHREISGIEFKPRPRKLESMDLQVHPKVNLGISLNLDLEPQSSEQSMDMYIKRCAYYLAVMRAGGLAHTNQSSHSDYADSHKAYTIWFSKKKLEFTGNAGIYHSMVVGNVYDIATSKLSSTRDLGLEEIFIISIPTIMQRYEKCALFQGSEQLTMLYRICKYLESRLDSEDCSYIEKMLNTKITIKGGILMFKTIEERVAEESEAKGKAEGEAKGKAEGKAAGKAEGAIKTARELKKMGIKVGAILEIIKNSVPEVFEQVKPEILKLFEE